MPGFQYVANTLTLERYWLQSSFFRTIKIKKLLGYKTFGAKTQQLLQEKDELGKIVSNHNLSEQLLCIKLHHFWRPLKETLHK